MATIAWPTPKGKSKMLKRYAIRDKITDFTTLTGKHVQEYVILYNNVIIGGIGIVIQHGSITWEYFIHPSVFIRV